MAGKTGEMLFSLSIFLIGVGAGIALAAFAASHSRAASGAPTASPSKICRAARPPRRPNIGISGPCRACLSVESRIGEG
jgi:hypothetical protein